MTTKLAFYGPACSGKTFSANYFVQQGYKKIAFADKLKEIAEDLFDVTGKNGSDRKLLQNLGQKMREINPNVWINYLLDTIKYLETNHIYPGYVLDDLRYENEAIALRKAGFQLIYVSTPQEILTQRRRSLYPDTPDRSYYHDSETGWKRIAHDYTVDGSDPAKGYNQLHILEQLMPQPSDLGELR